MQKKFSECNFGINNKYIVKNIDLFGFCKNPSPFAIEIIKTHFLEKINAEEHDEDLDDSPSNMDNFWYNLSQNPNALHILKENVEQINWNSLSLNTNPDVYELYEKHPYRLNWFHIHLNHNPSAIKILEKFPEKINWEQLFENPFAIHLIEKLKEDETILNAEYFYSLCGNKNAIHLIEKYMLSMITKYGENLNFMTLCKNENAIPLIRKYLNQNVLTYSNLSFHCLLKNENAIELIEEHPIILNGYNAHSGLVCNKNPKAIELLKKKIDFDREVYYDKENKIHKTDADFRLSKEDWKQLCKNPNALDIVLKYKKHINWYCLSQNPSIIENEYEEVCKHYFKHHLTEEMMSYIYHPNRMNIWRYLDGYDCLDGLSNDDDTENEQFVEYQDNNNSSFQKTICII